jgi:lysophospholipase L1-like esterase
MIFLIIHLTITVLFISCSSKDSSPLRSEDQNGIIDADNDNIQYVGRFDRSDPKRAIFDWSGIYIKAKFEGKSCSIRLIDGNNFYDVSIDNQLPKVLKTDTSKVYSVASNLTDTIHTILIQKRTEAFIGKGEFLGFILDEGKNLVVHTDLTDRRIEFIGNSITCGYGVEGESANSPFKPETENAALTYAGIISRTLSADYSIVAYSGKGMVRNYGDPKKMSVDPLPSIYNRTMFSDSTLVWDYSSWIPQVAFLNLGTNDFSTQPFPDKLVFQEAYKVLINRVQSQYPNVTIFCICGPMIGKPCTSYVEELVNEYRQNAINKEVYYIEVSSSKFTFSDWGSDWHPNVKGQQKMADIILPEIKDKMNW